MARAALSTRELNRALLARQLLLDRARTPLVRAVEQVGGLQSQYAPSAYLALWSRRAGFERSQLTGALERRRLAQGTLMRTTIHIVSARDYWPFAAGVAAPRRASWLAARPHRTGHDLEVEARRTRELLRDGPKNRDELAGDLDSMTWNGVGVFTDLVRVPPSGTWERRRADRYASAEDWLGPPQATEVQGREHLLRRYLAAFGPTRLEDAANWAGMPPSLLAPALERVPVRRLKAEDGSELIDLPRAPLPAADTPAPPRFLGTWDAILLVHVRRTQVLPEEYRPLVFSTKTPHSVNTFLVDGAVAGKWRVERTKDRATLLLQPFAPLPRAARTAVTAEAERLVRWHEDDATSHAVRLAR